MSRSGYSDDCDGWSLIRWRGAVASAMRGHRGQAFLKELLAALDAMPEKKLIAHELEQDGCYCALGVIGAARGMDLKSIDPHDTVRVAKEFGLADAMAKEIVFMNDEANWYEETPETRWVRMRAWIAENITEATP